MISAAPKTTGLCILISSTGWASILFSAALFALHWRAANEPGAGDYHLLLGSAWVVFGSGCAAFIGGQIRLVAKKEWFSLVLTWGICLSMFVLGVTLAPILLLLMV